MGTISNVDFFRRVKPEDIRANCSVTAVHGKDRIVEYFKSVPVEGCGSGFLKDMLTGKQTAIPHATYFDGEYTWTAFEPYYFEKYNLMLSPEFIEHALNREERHP